MNKIAILLLFASIVVAGNTTVPLTQTKDYVMTLPVKSNVWMVNLKTGQLAIYNAYFNAKTKQFFWRSTPFDSGEYTIMAMNIFDPDYYSIVNYQWKSVTVKPAKPPTLLDIKRYWLKGVDFKIYAKWAAGKYK